MLNLTFTDVMTGLVPLSGAFWLVLTNIKAGVEKHKTSTEAELQKQKLTIEADAKKEEVRILAEVEREKLKTQAEVDKIKEQGMGGQAVAKIWQAMDKIKEDVSSLEENQTKDHTDNIIRNEIVQRLHGEVASFTKLLFENILSRRQ